MKISSRLLQYIHLDKTYSLLSGKNVRLLLEMFKMLDIHDKMELNGKLKKTDFFIYQLYTFIAKYLKVIQ